MNTTSPKKSKSKSPKPKQKKPQPTPPPAAPADENSQKTILQQEPAQPAEAPATTETAPQPTKEERQQLENLANILGIPQMAKAITRLAKEVNELKTQKPAEAGFSLEKIMENPLAQQIIPAIISMLTGESTPQNETSAIEKELLKEAVETVKLQKQKAAAAADLMIQLLGSGYQGYRNEKGEIVIKPPEEKKE